MKELRFSVCNELPEIREVLKPFNQNRPENAQVQLHLVPWDNYKLELTTMALFGQEMVVSQVGDNLVSEFIAIKALRPFTKQEIVLLGGETTFSKLAWKNADRISEGLVYALPWIIDPRAIIYWRNMLEKADIEENTAFKSFAQMEKTSQRLQASGIKTPWLLKMDKLSALQTACTWIWGAGGEIGNESELLMLHPKALRGLRNYFKLSRFTGKSELQPHLSSDYVAAFAEQRAAISIATFSHYQLIKKSVTPAMQKQLGVVIAPGPLYVGSSSLVVWNGTRDVPDAVNLVRYMLSDEAQRSYCLNAGYLPARLNVLDGAPFATDPLLQTFVWSAKNGRSLSTANLKHSGLLMDLLANAISRIWEKFSATPDFDLDKAIHQELEPIVRKVNIWSK